MQVEEFYLVKVKTPILGVFCILTNMVKSAIITIIRWSE